ncbi:DUF3817 domain-containing protein [Nocardioides sp. TF02-7]|nr:DUF3817 domain-containing protein [Nocardioides sp. TF02-7]
MFLKYATKTTDAGVTVFGPLHGAAFLAYVVVTVLVSVDQAWGWRRTVVGLLAAVPPLATLPFDWWVERRRGLSDRWRLRAVASATGVERPVHLAVRHPLLGMATGLGVVAGLFGLALLAGPPA